MGLEGAMWVRVRQNRKKEIVHWRDPTRKRSRRYEDPTATIVVKRLVDRDGSARGLDETVVGGALTADGGVLAGVLDGDTDQDGDLLAVKADGAVEDLVESETETGKGVLGLLALLLLEWKSNGEKRGRMSQKAVKAKRSRAVSRRRGGNLRPGNSTERYQWSTVRYRWSRKRWGEPKRRRRGWQQRRRWS